MIRKPSHIPINVSVRPTSKDMFWYQNNAEKYWIYEDTKYRATGFKQLISWIIKMNIRCHYSMCRGDDDHLFVEFYDKHDETLFKLTWL